MATAQEVFAQAPLYTDEQLYRLIQLPAPAITAAAGILAEVGTPFSALVADKDEVSMLLPQAEWEQLNTRLPGYVEGGLYRLITFDAALDPDLTGFFALVTGILERADVSILALSAFSRDHVFVPPEQFDAAWRALQAAQVPPGSA